MAGAPPEADRSERGRAEDRGALLRDVVAFAVFFLVCLGLGYAPLARYDATTRGNVDARHYHAMIEGRDVEHPTADVFRARILVPALARPLASFFAGRVGSWSPTALALLVVNSLFVAATASLLSTIGRRTSGRREIGLLAALLYLASFAITNFHLAGHVDSAEGFCLLALVEVCLSRRWPWLVPLAMLGAAAKEAVLPLSTVFVVAWAWACRARRDEAPPPALSLAALSVGVISFAAVRRVVLGEWVLPWDVAQTMARPSLVDGLLGALDRSALYVFGWLLPLGLLRLRVTPSPWRVAALATTLAALALAVWAHGTVVRLAFDLAGPLLALGAAHYLLDGSDQRGARPRRE